MYPQVILDFNDQDVQWTLWREDPSLLLQCFHFSRLKFGSAQSAFLATRCLLQLSDENENVNSEASRIIHRDFHVDGFLSGGPTIEYLNKVEEEY